MLYNSSMSTYKRIGITAKSGLDNKSDVLTHVVSILQESGCEAFVDDERLDGTNLPSFSSEDDIDLLLVLGGDGTILRSVRSLQKCSVPILSINRGAVGFLAEVEYDEAAELLPKLLSGSGVLEERSLLSVHAYRGEEEILSGIALNEAVIAQGTIARLVDLDVSVNSESLTVFHADGLILATPTGSTAYSLSAGGPIVHPTLDATILTPINPHSFSQKPVLIRSDASVEIVVRTKTNKYQDTEVILTLDGQIYQPLQRDDRVVVTRDSRTVKFLRRKEDTFFGTLRQKLKWGERVD